MGVLRVLELWVSEVLHHLEVLLSLAKHSTYMQRMYSLCILDESTMPADSQKLVPDTPPLLAQKEAISVVKLVYSHLDSPQNMMVRCGFG